MLVCVWHTCAERVESLNMSTHYHGMCNSKHVRVVHYHPKDPPDLHQITLTPDNHVKQRSQCAVDNHVRLYLEELQHWSHDIIVSHSHVRLTRI